MRRAAWVFAVGVLALGGCGGEDEGGGDEPAEDAAPAEQADTQAEPELKCRKARRVLTQALATSLTITGGGGLRGAQVVKVPDPPPAPLSGFKRGVYVVAGELTGPGMDGTIGAWAVSRSMLTTGGGLAFALDAVTREFSDLGAAASDDSPARAYTDELEETEAYERAVTCAEG